jgi:hypothetical protein
MMCPDHGAIDHVGGDVSLDHFRQRFQHRVEHAGRYPAPVAPEHAVPLPYSSGRWRHCDPVRAIHIMPSKYSRLSCAGRQPRPFQAAAIPR